MCAVYFIQDLLIANAEVVWAASSVMKLQAKVDQSMES